MEKVSVVKEKYIEYIDGIIKNNKVSHAYLIEVDNYNEDLTYIYDFIKMILCNCYYHDIKNKDYDVARLIDDGNYPDIKIIEPDGSWIKKGQLLELLRDYSNTSLIGSKRIYIIKNAEKLNSSSANTILKFLEEPEDNIVAFLLTDNRYHVLDTILSRCQVLTLKENKFVIEDKDSFIDLLDCVLNPSNFFIKYNFLIGDVIPDKVVLKEKLLELEEILIKFLNYKYTKIDNSDFDEEIYNMILKRKDSEIIAFISIIEDEVVKLDFNVNYKLWLDSLFSKLMGVVLSE